MADIISLLNYEEGFSAKPYYCSAGYPTIGIGQRIGPKGAPLKLYEFTVSKSLAAVWLAEKVKETLADMDKYENIRAAMAACNEPRQAILISMAYQMGADGLSKFTNTLKSVATQNWHAAQAGMLASKWAKQTPNRANRHAIQLLNGSWYPDYK